MECRIRESIEDAKICGLKSENSLSLEKTEDTNSVAAKPRCPECGGVIRFQSGCRFCPSCGYSMCG